LGYVAVVDELFDVGLDAADRGEDLVAWAVQASGLA
jgi:hypothetical protein